MRVVKSRRMSWAVHVALWETGKVHTGFLVERPEGKRPLGRPGIRWEDNIKMDLQDGLGARSGLIWLRKGTGGGLLCMR